MIKAVLFPEQKHKRLLTGCLIASVGIHLMALLVIYENPFFLKGPLKLFFKSGFSHPMTFHSENLENLEKTLYLEEALNHIVVAPSLNKGMDGNASFLEEVAMQPKEEDLIHTEFAYNEELTLSEASTYKSTPILIESLKEAKSEMISYENTPVDLPLFSEEDEASPTNFLDMLTLKSSFPEQIDDSLNKMISLVIEEPAHEAAEDISLQTSITDITVDPSKKSAKQNIVLKEQVERNHALILSKESPLSLNILPKQSPLENILPNVAHYQLPEGPLGKSWSDQFKVDLHVFPDQQHRHYVFFLTLEPTNDLTDQKLKQNFHFLLDRSPSIEKHRFAAYKRGVLKALTSLNEGDSFNVYLFDQKLVKFKEENAVFSKKSLEEVEQFLNKEDAKRSFFKTDLCTNLEKLLPEIAANEGIHTAILLSDGTVSIKPERQQKILASCFANHTKNLSLYTASVGINNNKPLLSLISSLNKGNFLQVDTNASFPRKLAKMVLDLRSPIATNVRISSVTSDENAKVLFYPSSSKRTNIHANSPYVIAGTIDSLTDFTVLIQAKHGNEFVNIEKTISFSKAKKAENFHKALWSNIYAQKCYELFLEKQDSSYLDKAQKYSK